MLRNSELPKSIQISLAKSVAALIDPADTNVFFFIMIFANLTIITNNKTNNNKRQLD